jgi:hypothetical protein
MANEIQFNGPGPLRTCYYTVHNRTGSIWNTSGGTGAFDSFGIVNRPVPRYYRSGLKGVHYDQEQKSRSVGNR